ncbi:MAG: tetratricopeptide repeat protein [Bdellovibrionales bacterium]|nr:tetratricopeptide repeat protein [Bdellovibrionales bacterium]
MARIRLIIIFIPILIYGCSSMTVQVDSQPQGAEVYSQADKRLKKLGETPLNIPVSQIEGSNVHLVIKKTGFEPYSVILEKRTLSTHAQIFAQLDGNEGGRGIASANGGIENVKIEKVSRMVASIQSNLYKRNYDSAQSLAQNLVSEYPSFAVGWSLLGNAYYLQQRHQDALAAYYKALEFDPDNIEVQNLVNKIESGIPRSDR